MGATIMVNLALVGDKQEVLTLFNKIMPEITARDFDIFLITDPSQVVDLSEYDVIIYCGGKDTAGLRRQIEVKREAHPLSIMVFEASAIDQDISNAFERIFLLVQEYVLGTECIYKNFENQCLEEYSTDIALLREKQLLIKKASMFDIHSFFAPFPNELVDQVINDFQEKLTESELFFSTGKNLVWKQVPKIDICQNDGDFILNELLAP